MHENTNLVVKELAFGAEIVAHTDTAFLADLLNILLMLAERTDYLHDCSQIQNQAQMSHMSVAIKQLLPNVRSKYSAPKRGLPLILRKSCQNRLCLIPQTFFQQKHRAIPFPQGVWAIHVSLLGPPHSLSASQEQSSSNLTNATENHGRNHHERYTSS